MIAVIWPSDAPESIAQKAVVLIIHAVPLLLLCNAESKKEGDSKIRVEEAWLHARTQNKDAR